jgi:5-methylcytosine-specific restriction endonuclease McrA
MSAISQSDPFLVPVGPGLPPGGNSLLSEGVLVLNRHWTAVHVCTVRRALALLFQDLASVVTNDYEAHDFESWRDLSAADPHSGPCIRTPNFSLRVPEVIVLARYQGMPPRQLRFNRRNIFLRDGFSCQYCGAKPRRDDLTIDHIQPRSRGGLSTWENIAVACMKCNTKKGSRTPEEAGMNLLRKPKRPHWLSCLGAIPGAKGRTVWQKFVDKAYWNATLQE